MIIKWSPSANLDLKDIKKYIAKDNPIAAKQVINVIIKYTETLFTILRPSQEGRVSGSYELVIPKLPYILVYRQRNDTIEIIRIYHTSRPWPERF